MYSLLSKIKNPNDIKNIDPADYKELAKEIRKFLVKNVSRTGGHLASNLGAVELTMALHLCLQLPEDQIVWDVGHQSYTHKILTGRQEGFESLRKFGGMSGFPKRNESECDSMDTGHSSTSISAALGIAKARDLQGLTNKVVAVIGDGALSGGMAYEALNNAARLKSNMIIILNDNQMSISRPVGGMSNYLGKIRTNTNYTELKEDVENALEKLPKVGDKITNKIRGMKDLVKRVFIPGMLFEDMGITYIGPIDGHNIEQMQTAITSASKLDRAVMIHVITKKGKGFMPAEVNPSDFHGVNPFTMKNGLVTSLGNKQTTYTQVFSEQIVNLAERDMRIAGISAAMPSGTGLDAFEKEFPDRFFDVGIAEEHAVTFAAGLALGGMKPVVALYSTFLQRAYDQILHDVCIGGLPVVFAIDRAGVVGSDGETHQGVFDIAFLRQMPGLQILAPKNAQELRQMMQYALEQDGPVAIRYPRGAAFQGLEEFNAAIEPGKAEWINKGQKIALLAAGNMVETALQVREGLKSQGVDASVINARFLQEVQEELIQEIADSHSLLVTLEDGILTGGYGEAVASYCKLSKIDNLKVFCVAWPDQFIEHGSVEELRGKYGLDVQRILHNISKQLEEN